VLIHRVETATRQPPPDLDAAFRTGTPDDRSAEGSPVLDMAILGLLGDSPMHGYELRKQLATLLGPIRQFSYGSLYPTLRRLSEAGWIFEETSPEAQPGVRSRRGKRVYRLTADGKEHLADLLAEVGPDAYDDEGFGARLAFFGQTRSEVRLQILEGRRRRVEERREGLRATLGRTGQRLDHYTRELHRHGLDSVDREVRWLTELIASERDGTDSATPTGATQPTTTQTSTTQTSTTAFSTVHPKEEP
jgi:DNA-binding PadR family transcriptional regulator